jgi:bacterial/archaeal transporter family-2 protein
MTFLIPFLVILAGVGIPVQVAANHRLREAVQSPVMAVLIAFVIGTLALAAVTLLFGRGRPAHVFGVPWWAWIGGLLSAFAVFTSVVGFGHAGAGTVAALTVFGQLMSAVLLDHFAWLGAQRTPLNGWRIAGIVMLSVGAVLVQRK